MKTFHFFYLSLLLGFFNGFSQNKTIINAVFNETNKSIEIKQSITFQNTSKDVLNVIYLQDWTNSYSEKDTPLANRFAEEFKNTFHFANIEDRGFTDIQSITDKSNTLEFERLKDQIDIIKIELKDDLKPGTNVTLQLSYRLQVQSDKFTRYGFTDKEEFHLRYWYIVPAVYDGKWQYYSNKDLDDQFVIPYDITIKAEFNEYFYPISELNVTQEEFTDGKKRVTFKGKNRINSKFSLVKTEEFYRVNTDFYTTNSNIDTEDLNQLDIALVNDKIANYITTNLGEYPHTILWNSDIDYKKEPIYGLNMLPDFIRPFPDKFQFELKILKTSLRNYLENTLIVNPRKDQWILDGFLTYYLMKYVEEYYPDTKILGSISGIWGLRSFHASDLKFNEQYNFLYLHMARQAIDQPLAMAKDSLLKFNKNISNKYKAGVGLHYLNEFEGKQTIDQEIENFIKQNKLHLVGTDDLEKALKGVATKNIDWFFNEFIASNKKIDYKIKKVTLRDDSIKVTLKNLRNSKMPISFFTLKNDSVLSKQWINGFKGTKTFKIPNNNENKFALNFDNAIPEFRMRNNFKSLKGWFNKPLQLRIFKDVEDPNYNQIFFMPEANYNFYDGITIGPKLYNKTILSKRFLYRLSPQYAIKSKQFVGSGSLIYNNIKENEANYLTKYGISGEYFNYAPNLSYYSYNPYIIFNFRNPNDYRDNYRKFFVARLVTVNRDVDPTGEFETPGEPKYSVFNLNYGESDPNLKNSYYWKSSIEIAKDFGKMSGVFSFRKLNKTNQQLNLRLFAGAFLYNKTFQDSDFFSFALDRPTDYLFDYNYLGRSEETGLLSQQLIVSEGGFKSKLNTSFANQWIATANVDYTIWKYVQAYADIGLVGNRSKSINFVYDSGVRLNLVQDYFELYFPVYSNLGWEMGRNDYGDRIRFIVTISPQTLLGLFTRRWY